MFNSEQNKKYKGFLKRFRLFFLLFAVSLLISISAFIYLVFIRSDQLNATPYYKVINKHAGDITTISENRLWKHFNNTKLLAGDKIDANLTANIDNLGIIAVPFSTHNKSVNDKVVFRLKETDAKDWYYEATYDARQFQDNVPFPFGFPIIANSRNKSYTFQIESLSGTGNDFLSIDQTQNYFFTKYKFSKEELIKNPLKLAQFIIAKAIDQLSLLTMWQIMILFLFPVLFPSAVYLASKIVKLIIKFRFLIFKKFSFIILPIFIIFPPILYYGNIQFPGIDGGVLAHAGWQLHIGQIPYKDLITLVPPGFLLGVKWAYDFFGDSWSSQLKFLAIFAYITYLFQFIIFIRLGMSKKSSFIAAIFIQLITSIVITMWWYNNITSVSAALFMSSAFLFYKNPKSFINCLLFFSTTFLLLLMKVNIVGILIGSVYIIFILSKSTRLKSIAISIASLMSTLLFLYVMRINPMDVLYAYSNGTSRLALESLFIRLTTYEPLQLFPTIIFCIPFFFSLIMLGDYIFSRDNAREILSKYRIYIFLIFIGFLTCIWGLMTNSDLRMGEFPVFFVSGLIFLIILKNDIADSKAINALSLSKIFYIMMTSVVLLSAMATVWTVYRRRVEAVGDYYRGIYETHLVKRINGIPYFNGFSADPYFVNVVEDIERLGKVLRQENATRDYKLYFGTRIEFGYTMFNVRPIKGIPLWWWEGQGIPNGMTGVLVNNFKKANFMAVITRGGDLTFHPPEIIEELNKNYRSYVVGNLIVWINLHEIKLLKRFDLDYKRS